MIDPDSITWRTLEKRLQAQRIKLIEELIDGAPSDDKLRGRIFQIDMVLDMAKPDKRPDIPPPAPNPFKH